MTSSIPPDDQRAGATPASIFDPQHGTVPDLERFTAGETGPVLLLLDAADDRTWATEAATALCTDWARHGRRIVLADLHLDEPVLHELAGESELEGVVDVFLYGASLTRSARPVRGRGFFVITAGTYTPDPEAIYSHPRWRKLAAGFRDADALLVLFLPVGSVGLPALAEWASEAIVLGSAQVDLPGGLQVAARLVPPPTPEPPPSARTTPLPEADEVLITPIAADGDLGPPPAQDVEVRPVEPVPWEAAPAEPPAGASPEREEVPPVPEVIEEPEVVEEPVLVEERRRPRRSSTWLWVLVAAAAVGIAGYLLASARPELFRPDAAPAELGSAAAVASPAPAEVSPPAVAGTTLPYAVQVKAFTSFAAAHEDATAQADRFSEAPFYVSPERIQGMLYFKVLSGAAPDTVVATDLRQRLVERDVVDQQDALGSWSLIQYTPLAFELGEFPSEGEARAAVDSLTGREIPAYTVPLPYSDGSQRWRIYGGAFRDSASAQAMRELLSEAGLAAPLVARIGAVPQG